MNNEKIERKGEAVRFKLKILFLYGIFFCILKILDMILNSFPAYY